MERVIDLGDLIIPLIKPQKGVDYYTASEKQELVNIVTNNVNEVVLPQEEIRQSNEVIRQDNEATRQSQEDTRQSNETSRQTAETARASAESTRQSNETSRVSAEETRAQTFSSQMDAVDTAIAEINTSQTAFNENATSKTSDFNTNATNKTTAFNENATSKTNAFDEHTEEIQTKLATIETGAEVNIIETVKVNGTALTPTDKEVDVPVPTKTSDLDNDSGFGTYTKPSGGIPKTDLSSDVQASLGKADSALQEHQDISGKVDKEHKTGSQVEYKVLSDNNYTDAEKEKLASLENYDDTDITERVEDIEEEQETQNEDIEKLQDKVANQQKILSQMPKVTGEGTEFTMENTIEAQFAEFLPGGNTEQETTNGYQLLNITANTQTNYGVTLTNNHDGTVTLNGTSTQRSGASSLLSSQTSWDVADLPQTATFQVEGLPDNVSLGLSYNNSSGTWIQNAIVLTKTDSLKSATLSIPENAKYVRMNFTIEGATVLNNVIIRPYLVSGIHTASTMPPYEKYTGGIASPNVDYPSERYSAGANGSITEKIVNKNFKSHTLDNVYIGTNNVTNKRELMSISDATCFWFKVLQNETYTFSREKGDRLLIAGTNVEPAVGVQTFDLYDGGNSTEKSHTVSNTTYQYLVVYSSRNQSEKANWVQLELGSTATSYVEHQEQTYTMPVQQEMRDIKDSNGNVIVEDEFIEEDGVKYERHNVKRVVFDGTETWTVEQSSGKKRFNHTFSDLYYYNGRGEYAKSNYFHSTTNSEYGAIITYQSQIMIYVSENITTIEQFTAWLAQQYANGTPVYVDYVLKTPIDLPCTQEQITALESMPDTYAGQTIILSEDSVPANVKASGYLDLNTLITRVAQLETEV